tara:strand:- start:868 stop:999 length:132 start_codon:yes stop_codon:yes gene_type:complete
VKVENEINEKVNRVIENRKSRKKIVNLEKSKTLKIFFLKIKKL